MKFEWDRQKAKANIAKHGVSFERAKAVFADELAITEPDNDATEVRWRIMGLAEGVLIFVVYTEQEVEGEQIIRLISARQPTRAERKRYEEES
jgi:uncharacterized protein